MEKICNIFITITLCFALTCVVFAHKGRLNAYKRELGEAKEKTKQAENDIAFYSCSAAFGSALATYVVMHIYYKRKQGG